MLMIRVAEDWRGIGVVAYEHVQTRDPHTHYVEAFFWARPSGAMDSCRVATHHDQFGGFRANEYLTRAACRWLASAGWAVDRDPTPFVEPGLALKPFDHKRTRDVFLDAALDAPELLEFVSGRTRIPALREVAQDAAEIADHCVAEPIAVAT
jgi:hypothetical protein